jgi:nitrite reductase (NADH) small subunit/3-phenylpropionate/trans-cinnamate dioxygenase ferredoxin subunit
VATPAEEYDTRVRPEELEPGRPRAVATPWGEYALFRSGAETLAVQAFCPHLAGPLFQGTRSGETITCPWHRWRYSLRTGERLDPLEPGSDRTPLSRCAVRVGPAGTLVLARPERGPVLP